MEPWDEIVTHAFVYTNRGWEDNNNQFIMSQKTYSTQNSIGLNFYSYQPVASKHLEKHRHDDGSEWMWSNISKKYGKLSAMSITYYAHDYHHDGSVTYNYKLNREFYKLTGIFGVDDLTNESAGPVYLLIEGDNGKVLYESDSIQLGDEPINVEVDLLDQSEITITITQEGTQGHRDFVESYVQFTDVKLYKVEKQ